MKHLITILFLFFCSLSVEAQYTLPSSQIDVIAYDSKGYFYFYQQKGEDMLLRMQLNEDREKIQEERWLSKLSWHSIDNPIPFSELQKKGLQLIYIKDIRPTQFKDFQQKDFTFYGQLREYTTTPIVKFFSENLGAIQLFSRKTIEGKEYLFPDRHYFSIPLVLNFSDGKKAYMLYNHAIIIPLKDENRFITDWFKGANAPLEPTSPIKVSYYANFSNFYAKGMFISYKRNNGYELINNLGTNLLSQTYDTLYFNDYAIVGKKANEFSVYNLLLEKQPIKGIKALYLYNSYDYVEILTSKGAYYYSFSEKKPLRRVDMKLENWCPVGKHDVSVSIEKDTTAPHPYTLLLAYHIEGFQDKKFPLIDRTADEELSLLSLGAELPFIRKVKTPSGYCVVVKKNGKYGLMNYPYHEDAQPLEANVLLPITFDKIEKREDQLVYIYKNGKVGIYPEQEKPLYDSIQPLTHSFYRITKNGKQGYLDIRTFKEYFFE